MSGTERELTEFPVESIKDGHYDLFRLQVINSLTSFYRTHIVNIVHLPLGEKFALDVAFGGDGPITPLLLEGSRTAVPNIGPQQVRLIQDTIPKQQLETTKLWIYQYRNGPDREWNSFYSFAELEFFQEDFEVMNWFASARTLHRWTVLVVRFLREADCSLFSERGEWGLSTADVGIVGKVMLVNDVVKVNLGGKTEIVRSFDSEKGRLQALKEYFGIELTSDQQQGILGWDMRLTN